MDILLFTEYATDAEQTQHKHINHNIKAIQDYTITEHN